LAEQFEDVPSIHHDLSLKEKLIVLAKAITIIQATDGWNMDAGIIDGLRKVQRNLRWEVFEANRPNFVQPRITKFFS